MSRRETYKIVVYKHPEYSGKVVRVLGSAFGGDLVMVALAENRTIVIGDYFYVGKSELRDLNYLEEIIYGTESET